MRLPLKSIVSLVGITLTLLVAGTGCKPKQNADSVSGTIETDEARVASRYGGRVEKIFAWEGNALTNGQLIAQLDAAELRAQRDLAAAQLAELEAGFRKEEIAAAEAQWEALKADLDFARLEAKRFDELFSKQAVSASERDRALSRTNALEKSAAAAKSQYNLLLAGTRPEQITQARARVAQIKTQLDEMTIVSSSDSVVEVLNVKVGDVLAPNQQVATLLLTNHIWVRVFVPEPWLGHIKLGEQVKVRVDSFHDKDFNGQVEQIAREAEFTPRNVQTVGERIKQVFGIKVKLDNSSGDLRAGMAADVSFPNVPR
jgi:HlyD family secretion protein